MIKPKPGSIYHLKRYWEEVEAMKSKGIPTKWLFDFISVHKSKIKAHDDDREGWCFVSPLCLCDDGLAPRPQFENIRIVKKADAIKAARDLGKKFGVHVVIVDN